MSGVNGAIGAAFKVGLLAFAAANSVPTARICWPNEAFDPNAEGDALAGTFWLRPTLLPGQPSQLTLGDNGFNRQVGLYQVSVFWPRYEGQAGAQSLADAMASYFKRGSVFRTAADVAVQTSMAYSAPVRDEEGWHHIAVKVGYEAIVLNQ